MAPRIEVIRDHKELRIYIDCLLHFNLLMKRYNGLQSYIEGNYGKIHVVEFYIKDGDPIRLEYEQFSLWKEVLTRLNEKL